jgi:DNA-binding transcriptional MerR regulator
MIAMTITEIAAAFGVTPRALRFYESKGLLCPLREAGRRIYFEEDQRRLAMILKGRKLGFALSEIAVLIGPKYLGADLKLTRQECAEQIIRLEARVGEIAEALTELRQMMRSWDVPTPLSPAPAQDCDSSGRSG